MSTIEIPGGTATFRDKLTTERQRRPIKVAASAASDAIGEVADQIVDGDVKPEDVKMSDIHMDLAGAASMATFQDAVILAYLESWTLPQPLPTSIDAMLDLDPDVYDALSVEAARIYALPGPKDTSVDLEMNSPSLDESPTGGSTSSVEPSPETTPSPSTETFSTDGGSIASTSADLDSPTTST